MSDLVQIVYVSRSTFTTMPAERGIEPSVARILAQSRVNNARRGLVGALYFGDGCFFQCLEGRATDVDRLYAALLRDPRHTDLKLLSRRSIDRTRFSAWTMKYVPLDAEMKALLHEIGQQAFDPYRFDADTVTRVLDMLTRSSDLAPPAAAAAQASAATAATPSGARGSRLVWAGVGAVVVIVAGLVAMRAFG